MIKKTPDDSRIQRIKAIFDRFESLKQINDGDDDRWSARELQKILGYDKWDNFLKTLEKAMQSCESGGESIADHFPEVGKMINVGKGGQRDTKDYSLSRYACYLIAQNGDSRKETIADAQTYFAVQTHGMEIYEKYRSEIERVDARFKLTQTEKELSGHIYKKTNQDSTAFGFIRSEGDKVLFGGHTTEVMKEKLAVPTGRPLADFLPTVTIKAKDLASEMTNHQLKTHDTLYGKDTISKQHNHNNAQVRRALTDSGITPEILPPSEDIKKVAGRIKKGKSLLSNKS